MTLSSGQFKFTLIITNHTWSTAKQITPDQLEYKSHLNSCKTNRTWSTTKPHLINSKTNHTWSTVIRITLDQLQNRPTLLCVAHPDEVNGEVVVNLGAIYPSNDVVGCHSRVQVWVSGALPDPAWKPPGQAVQLDVRVSLQGKFTLWIVHEKWDGGLTVYTSTPITPTHTDRNDNKLAEHSASTRKPCSERSLVPQRNLDKLWGSWTVWPVLLAEHPSENIITLSAFKLFPKTSSL